MLIQDCEISKKYIQGGEIIAYLFRNEDGFCIPLSVSYLKEKGIFEDWWQHLDCEEAEVDFSESNNSIYLRSNEKVGIDTSDIIATVRDNDFCNGRIYPKNSGIELDNQQALRRFETSGKYEE